MVRALDHVGQLPEPFELFDYANVAFVGDEVFIMYRAQTNRVVDGKLEISEEPKMKIAPIAWLYQDA